MYFFMIINTCYFHRVLLSPKSRGWRGAKREKITIVIDSDSNGDIAGLIFVCLIVYPSVCFYTHFTTLTCILIVFAYILNALSCILFSIHAYHWVWINVIMILIFLINPVLSYVGISDLPHDFQSRFRFVKRLTMN